MTDPDGAPATSGPSTGGLSGAGMHVGVALDLAPRDGTTYAQRIEDLAPVLEACASNGYRSLSVGECYASSPSDPMGFHSPNALLLLGALADRLREQRLVAGVALIGGWHPLRLAYDAALVDQISGGRLSLGLGLGSPGTWRAFGLDEHGRGQRMVDTITVLKDAWQGRLVSGSAHVEVLPPPVQAGGPPLLIGGSRRVSAERAASLGDGFVASSGYDIDLIARQAGHYWSALDGRSGSVSVNRFMVVRESRAAALALYDEFVAPIVAAYGRIVPAVAGTPGVSEADAREALCLIGTPEEVAHLVGRYARCGVTDLQLRVAPWGMPAADAAASLDLFASAVRPQFEFRAG